MPGSGDDKPLDKILNCIMRSHALMNAQSVRFVYVLKIKGYDAMRFQVARSEIEFVASSFIEPTDFVHIMILVTHAEENEDDRRTLGKLRSYFRRIKEVAQDVPWESESAEKLHEYLLSECDKAVSKLEKREENIAHVRVVRPLESQNREAILDFLDMCYVIDSPSRVFRLNLEKDAEELVMSMVSREHENICQWLSASFDYGKVATMLLETNQVLQALGKSSQLRLSTDRVLQANFSLYNDIKRVAQSILLSPLESVDVETLVPLVQRFQEQQAIFDSAGGLLSGDWKSLQKLMWDQSQELDKYISLENKKGSWDALGGCAQRIKLLSRALKNEDAEQQASKNIFQALQSRVETVREFEDPNTVADALVDLQKASLVLTGNFQLEAIKGLDSSKQLVVDELDKLVQQISCHCLQIENDLESFKDSDKVLLHKNVTKLYRFTRLEQRIDDFLPPDSRSDAEGGFYQRFLSDLKLDQGNSLDRSRPQLLQHYNLLSCLLEVDDDELKVKLQLHMDSLKANLEQYLDEDFRNLTESYEAITNNKSRDSVDARAAAAQKFKFALRNAAQLLRVDDISREKLCSSRLLKFLQTYFGHITELEKNIRRGISSVAMIEQCLCMFMAFKTALYPISFCNVGVSDIVS